MKCLFISEETVHLREFSSDRLELISVIFPRGFLFFSSIEFRVRKASFELEK